MAVHHGSSGSKASGHRHMKEGGYHFTILTGLGDQGLRKSYFPQLGVVISNTSIWLRGFYVFR